MTRETLSQFIDFPEFVVDGLTKREQYLMRAVRQAMRAEAYPEEAKAQALHSANAWLKMAELENG